MTSETGAQAVSATLKVKVVPGASQTEVSGWLGDMLKVRVASPPEKGKANSAVVVLLAKRLGVAKKNVCIAAGKTSQIKLVEIHGLSIAQVKQKLDA